MASFRVAFFRLFVLEFRLFVWRVSLFRLFALRYFIFSAFRMALFRLFVLSRGVFSSFRFFAWRYFGAKRRNGTNQPPYSQQVFIETIWAETWQNQQNDLCDKWRLRSAWASTQSDQSSLYAQWVAVRTQTFFMRTAQANLSIHWVHRSFCWLSCCSSFILHNGNNQSETYR